MFLCAFPVLSDWINALHSYCCSWIFVNLLAIVNASSLQVLVDVFVAVQRSSMLLVTVRWYSTMVCVITCVVLCYWKLIGYARCSAKQSSRPCSTYGWRVCLFVLLSCLLVRVRVFAWLSVSMLLELFRHLCDCLMISLVVCFFVRVLACLSISVCAWVCSFGYWFGCLFVCLFACLCVWLLDCWSVCSLVIRQLFLSVFACMCVCILVCVCLCVSGG